MNMHIIPRSFVAMIAAAGMLSLGACSSPEDKANEALKEAGVDAEISTGKLPAGFPADVPTPDLSLESAVGAAGNFTVRYKSKDAAAEVAAYKEQLKSAGFTISGEADNSATAGGSIAFLAEKGTNMVAVGGFGEGTPGGAYLGVVVTSKG